MVCTSQQRFWCCYCCWYWFDIGAGGGGGGPLADLWAQSWFHDWICKPFVPGKTQADMVTTLSCYAFNSFILCFFYGRWYLCSLSQPSCFIRMWNWHNSSWGIAHNLDNSRKTMATNLFKSLMYSHVVAVIIIFTLLQAVWSVSVCMNAIILEIMLYSFIRYFFSWQFGLASK